MTARYNELVFKLDSVVTGVLVATIVEATIKPWAQAVQAVVLARRELRTTVLILTVTADRFIALADAVGGKTLVAEGRDEQYAVLKSAARKAMLDDLPRYAGAYGDRYRQAVIEYVGSVYGITISGRTRRDQARIIKALGEPMATAVQPWWTTAVVVRRRALRKVQQIIDDPDAALPLL